MGLIAVGKVVRYQRSKSRKAFGGLVGAGWCNTTSVVFKPWQLVQERISPAANVTQYLSRTTASPVGLVSCHDNARRAGTSAAMLPSLANLTLVIGAPVNAGFNPSRMGWAMGRRPPALCSVYPRTRSPWKNCAYAKSMGVVPGS